MFHEFRVNGEDLPHCRGEDTAREMAASHEDWSEWDATTADGLDHLPWPSDAGHVAERAARYGAKPRFVG